MSFEINEYLVSAFSLLLHAFALLNLMTCDFTSFILLLAAAFYADQVAKKFLIIKESTLWYEQYFNNMADWIRLISLFFVFTSVYSKTINYIHGIVFFTVLIGANIRYTSTVSLERRQGKKLEHGVELWTKLFDGISDSTMKIIKKNSFVFKERLVAAYILVLIFIIHLSH